MSSPITKITGELTRSYLLGRSSGDAVTQEREEVISMLVMRGLATAAHATRQSRSFQEFFNIRQQILCGGPALVRKKKGRSL